MPTDYGSPPFSGTWKRREELPKKLDSAKSLSDIAYYCPFDRQWVKGITTHRPIQYWVRIETKEPSNG